MNQSIQPLTIWKNQVINYSGLFFIKNAAPFIYFLYIKTIKKNGYTRYTV